MAEIAKIVWEACGNEPDALELSSSRASRSTCSAAGPRSRRPARARLGGADRRPRRDRADRRWLRPLTSFWAGRRVLVTGHSGFKGGWLTLWLHALGARVTGFSGPPPSEPSLFALARVGEVCDDRRGDVCDADAVSAAVSGRPPGGRLPSRRAADRARGGRRPRGDVLDERDRHRARAGQGAERDAGDRVRSATSATCRATRRTARATRSAASTRTRPRRPPRSGWRRPSARRTACAWRPRGPAT